MREQAYSPTSRWLHWLTLLFLTANYATAWSVDLLAHTEQWLLVDAHRTIGMLLWSMVLVRLIYRWIVGTPPAEPGLPRWQVWSAHATHWALYGLLLMVPVLGYLYADARALPDLFGTLHLPSFLTADRQIAGELRSLHALAADMLLGLIGLHAAAALFHHYWMRDGVLRRMLPLRPRLDDVNVATPAAG